MKASTVAVALGALLVGGCAAMGPRAAAPALVEAGSLAGVSATGVAPAVDDRWWREFKDPQLDQLVEEALAASPTITAAVARLAGAEALATAARGGRLPATGLSASVERERLSEKGLYPPPYGGSTLNLGQLGLDFSYELDLLGRVRAEITSSEASTSAARSDLAAARLGVATAVARTYLKLARSYALADTLNAAGARRREQLGLTEQRVRAGLDTQFETEAARAQLASSDQDLAAEDEERALLLNELAALLGAGPGRAAALARPVYVLPAAPPLPAELPASLVGRRPDVAAERARVESAAASVRVAETAFYPNVNLSAFAGFQSIALGSLIGSGTRSWSAGPALSLPLFFTDRLRGQLGARDADYVGAVARYNSTVIEAFHEVADALASLRLLEREQNASAAAVAALEHANELALIRYRAGLTNYLTVLIAEQNLLQQRRLAVDLEARRADLAVALIRALGGGFSA